MDGMDDMWDARLTESSLMRTVPKRAPKNFSFADDLQPSNINELGQVIREGSSESMRSRPKL